MEWIQQGDVRIKPIDKLPEGCVQVKGDIRGHVFAEGEATGHYHAVRDALEVGVSKLYSLDGKLYFENEKNVTIEHQEHDIIEIPTGSWEISRVFEYDHFTEELKEVAD
jgi:hypothetical protein